MEEQLPSQNNLNWLTEQAKTDSEIFLPLYTTKYFETQNDAEKADMKTIQPSDEYLESKIRHISLHCMVITENFNRINLNDKTYLDLKFISQQATKHLFIKRKWHNCLHQVHWPIRLFNKQRVIQGVPKRYIHKVNIPYYNVYTSFWDTLYIITHNN
jgi:hypothetical protein